MSEGGFGMTEIERLAQVAHDAACVEVSSSRFFLSDDGAANIVRAILTAMREPSDEAIRAGKLRNGYLAPVALADLIDHILAEPK